MGKAMILSFLFLFFISLDIYTYFGISSFLNPGKYAAFFKILYLGISFFTYFSSVQLLYFLVSNQLQHRTEYINFIVGFVFTVLVFRLIFSFTMLLQDGARVIIGAFQYIKFLYTTTDSQVSVEFIPGRRGFLTAISSILAGIPFVSMLYGITKGKYQYTVETIQLTFDDLPKSFDKFRIVQISDIHAGSFDNKEKVKAGIQKLNELNADIVCFTGDLVNSEKEEIDPYIDVFADIKARYGKFASLGNHDYYGNYNRNDKEAEKMYINDFYSKFNLMGFELLNNENRSVSIGNDTIKLIGVENWGAGRWFPKKGDLDKATSNINTGEFCILMSHDPSHWDEKVLPHSKHIHLTLSGHTHGFQFGVHMPGIKWSPAQYRYKRWMGLYQETKKYLYVNRGFGFLGFPGRVGMWPEITLIELRSSIPDIG